MIVLTRVDYRLIHGQVAMTWTRTVGADCILVANDAVAASDVQKAALRMARPSGVKLGGTRSTDEATHHLSTAIFATDADLGLLRELAEKGVELEIRQVPTEQKVDASTLI